MDDITGVVHYRAVLIRSVGVTATTLSTIPASIPAKIPLAGESFPSSSISLFLIESNERNLTPALKAVPCQKM